MQVLKKVWNGMLVNTKLKHELYVIWQTLPLLINIYNVYMSILHGISCYATKAQGE